MTLQSKTANATAISTLLANNTTKAISAEDARTVVTNLLDGIWGRVSASIDDGDSPYTADLDAEQIILADPTSGAITVNLPDLTTCQGQIILVKNIGTTNSVTLDGYEDDPIDGSTTLVLSSQYDFAMLFAGSGSWHVIGSN